MSAHTPMALHQIKFEGKVPKGLRNRLQERFADRVECVLYDSEGGDYTYLAFLRGEDAVDGEPEGWHQAADVCYSAFGRTGSDLIKNLQACEYSPPRAAIAKAMS